MQPVEMDVTIGDRGASQVLTRVLQPNELGYQGPCEYDINVREITSNFDTVGAVTFTDRAATFDDLAPGDTVELEASHQLEHTVGKETIEIEFSFNYTKDGEQVDIPGVVRTSHVIYRVADTPNAPQATPWVCVLDKAVQWAGAADSVPAVQTAMEAALNTASGWKAGQVVPFEYDITGGGANYASFTVGLAGVEFRLANFMMFLHRARNANVSILRSYSPGPPVAYRHEGIVNCIDCAAALPCFTNALGANLNVSRIATAGVAFNLNPILPIGRQTWSTFFFQPNGFFGWHAVATQGAGLTDATRVYDSCLRLGTPDPTQFVVGGAPQPLNVRLSNGSIFDAPSSLTLSAASGPGGNKGSLNGRPSNSAAQPDPGPDGELNGITATYTLLLTSPLQYDVDRSWVAPAQQNNNQAQGAGLDVRVPPAAPGAGTDCLTLDGCARFEVVEGATAFDINDTFSFTSTFDYDGEYRGALSLPGATGRGRCNWSHGPFIPNVE